jgi:hypothetical protein
MVPILRPNEQWVLRDRHFVRAAIVGMALPYAARVPGLPWHGAQWLNSYLPSVAGVAFIAAFNAIPIAVLGALRLACRRRVVAFWCAAAAAFLVLALSHATLDLASDAQAGIALIFIPVYAAPAALLGWLVGLLVERARGDRAPEA